MAPPRSTAVTAVRRGAAIAEAARADPRRPAGRGADRDGLRPRRRRHQRRRGGAHLRRQGPPELQSADRPRRRPRRGRAARRVQRRSARAGRGALARAADPGRPAARGCAASPASSPPACHASRCASPRIPAMQALARGVRPAARRALGQCQRPDQPDPRRAMCSPASTAASRWSSTAAPTAARHRIRPSSPRPAGRCACCAAARSTIDARASRTATIEAPGSSPAIMPRPSRCASTRPRRETANI